MEEATFESLRSQNQIRSSPYPSHHPLFLTFPVLHQDTVSYRMSSQIDLSVEGSPADGTDERFVSRVFSAVGDEIGRLAESLATLGALVGFLARVDVRVLLHVGLLVKPLATIFAGKRPRVRVDEHVGGEGGGTLEGLVALFALEDFLVRVDGFVLFQAHRVPKRFLAQVALEWSPS